MLSLLHLAALSNTAASMADRGSRLLSSDLSTPQESSVGLWLRTAMAICILAVQLATV